MGAKSDAEDSEESVFGCLATAAIVQLDGSREKQPSGRTMTDGCWEIKDRNVSADTFEHGEFFEEGQVQKSIIFC